MLAINIQGPCTASHASCWSKQHRCFVACQDHVITRATYVLGSYQRASEWFTRPAFGLGRHPPCSLLVDADDYRQVFDLLYRIEFGIY